MFLLYKVGSEIHVRVSIKNYLIVWYNIELRKIFGNVENESLNLSWLSAFSNFHLFDTLQTLICKERSKIHKIKFPFKRKACQVYEGGCCRQVSTVVPLIGGRQIGVRW